MAKRPETVSVIGLGYIGLPLAAALAGSGVQVIGVDVKEDAVALLNAGGIHISEPGLTELVQGAVKSGKFRAVTKPEAADAFVIAVPTPVMPDRSPDMTYVEAATASIAPVLKKGDLVVLESTSPVGTIEALGETLAKLRPDLTFPAGAGEDADVMLAYCPERILPGNMVRELTENDRIIGGMTEAATEAAMALYSQFVKGELIPTDSRTAAATKLVENAFRDVNIAFANELANVCDHMGLDVWKVIACANHHPRVNILTPGPGVGGHCIPVDPWLLIHDAKDQTPLMQTARHTNDARPAYIARKIVDAAKGKSTIACLGLTYKPDTDDLRESPAIELVHDLKGMWNGKIVAVEPLVEKPPKSLVEAGVPVVPLEQALKEADVIALVVGHKEFKSIDRSDAGKVYFDACGGWR